MRSFVTSLYTIAAIVVGIFIVNTAAQFYMLYVRFWWLDGAMHFLAGMWLACVCIRWMVSREEFAAINKNWWLFIGVVLAAVALIGVGWEVYEFGTDLVFGNQENLWKQINGLADTMSDLLLDIGGAALVAVLAVVSTRKKS